MKKYLALLLALAMVFAFAACGDKDPEPAPADPGTSTPASQPAGDPTPDAPSAPDAPAEGTPMETEFWSAVIPEGLPVDEDYCTERDGYTYHEFTRYDEEGSALLTLTLCVESEDTMDYRDTLLDYGYSFEDQAAGNMGTVSLGGLDFVDHAGTYWFEDSMTYVARPAGSGKTVTILIYGEEINDTDAVNMLNSLQFDVPDTGFVEAPYPQDGQPYIAETGTVELDGITLTAEQLIADESLLAMDIFDNRVAVVGNTLYALCDKVLNVYNISGTSLVLANSYELEEEFESMSLTKDGSVFLSAFMEDLTEYKNGAFVRAWDADDEMSVSPDGTFAITFFTQEKDLKKLTLNDGTVTEAEFVLSGGPALSMVTGAFVTENYVGLNASSADDNRTYLYLYDHDGNFIMQLKDEDDDSLGSITAMAEFGDYLIALDGNLREFLVWDKSGKCLGAADDGKLFGSDYPWISGLCVADGSIYVSMVDERPDGSWDEMIFFRVFRVSQMR